MLPLKFLFLLLFVPFISETTDLKPWFGNRYEAEIRATLLYQNYSSISIPHHCSYTRHEHDTFTTLSAAYPFKRYCGEFEATTAHTRHQKSDWDNFRITGRYLWMDELDGDLLNLVTGITITEPYSRALRDVSSFHHGHIEGEANLSYGQIYRTPSHPDDLIRWWNVFGIGIAEKGSPWLRGDAVCEYCVAEVHHIRGFINTLCGLGRSNLHTHHFKGYGPIKHKSVDVGVRYGFTIGNLGILSIQYARRVYAYNFPKNANLFSFEFYLPFGTQPSTNY